MDWDSSVPQAASIKGRGEGTCMALVGFHPGCYGYQIFVNIYFLFSFPFIYK
jgi:hypothetical protein